MNTPRQREEKKMGNYVGAVVDRLTGKTVYRSRPVAWEQAQRRAERQAKGDRYLVVLYPSTKKGCDL